MLIDKLLRLRQPSRRIVAQPVILYVESNRILAQLVRDMLALGGWHVWCAHDGMSARSFLLNEQPYALLLVDNELQDTTGLEVIKYARRLPQWKSLPIILFSIEDYAEEAKRAGANEFLRKPHDLFQMVDIIRRLIVPGDKK